MSDLISKEQAIEEIKSVFEWHDVVTVDRLVEHIKALPSAQKTAKRIVGRSRSGLTMWLECSMCHEQVDEKDTFCRGCGRRFEDE